MPATKAHSHSENQLAVLNHVCQQLGAHPCSAHSFSFMKGKRSSHTLELTEPANELDAYILNTHLRLRIVVADLVIAVNVIFAFSQLNSCAVSALRTWWWFLQCHK